MSEVIVKQILNKKWFYRFQLPSGEVTESYMAEDVVRIHDTRLQMMDSILEPRFKDKMAQTTAVDLACHEGFFGCHLAAKGMDVMGIEARQEHVDDANLIAQGLNLSNKFKVQQADVHDVSADRYGQFDIVLMLGLIYHLENPVGAIRTAYDLCRDVCLIETQVAPNLSGQLDWGNYQFVKPMMGSFAIIDETEELYGPEMSTTGICLAPSIEALVWVMRAVGFKDVSLIKPPADAYEQHRFKKRVMAVGYK